MGASPPPRPHDRGDAAEACADRRWPDSRHAAPDSGSACTGAPAVTGAQAGNYPAGAAKPDIVVTVRRVVPLRVLAVITDAEAARRILDPLGVPSKAPRVAPARDPCDQAAFAPPSPSVRSDRARPQPRRRRSCARAGLPHPSAPRRAGFVSPTTSGRSRFGRRCGLLFPILPIRSVGWSCVRDRPREGRAVGSAQVKG